MKGPSAEGIQWADRFFYEYYNAFFKMRQHWGNIDHF